MRAFMDKDFLLSNPTSVRLFHEAAADQPIFDYHCHLIPREIAENRRFSNLTEIWLGGDHYKWRTMRACGIDERLITGSAPDYEKFMAWARTVPRLLGNPLYHWTHLELQRYFGITEPLSEASAPRIWEQANARLAESDLCVDGIFKKFRVRTVGTTDDPADSLDWHAAIKKAGRFDTRVVPSFRPDKAMLIEKPGYADYIAKLGKAAGREIRTLDDLLSVLQSRVDFFDQMGCRASDHGIEYVPYAIASEAELKAAFELALSGKVPAPETVEAFKTHVLAFLGRAFAKKGWAMQLHLNAVRSVNSRMLSRIGPDSGYDASHDRPVAEKLALFLNLLDSTGELPKTVLYSLNPKDYYPLATVMGCFQGDGVMGKLQLGSAWWFCDHKDGMEEQLRILANVGLLPIFIGMLTDSRSFLSYPRHEYFRRILCDLIGRWAEAGEIPNDFDLLSRTVSDICYANAERYFSAR